MPITDLLTPVTSSASARPATDTLAAPGYTHGATSATLSAGTNWADGVIFFTIYTTTTIGSTVVKDPTTQTDWKATKSGTSLTNMTLTGGSATQDYTTGAIVELTPTSRYAYDLYQWAIAHGNLDGSLKAAAVQTALGLGAGSLNGWNALGFTFGSVTANGNRSYTCVVSGQDVTGTLSAGMRIRTTRTVAAPTQATSLNGTNQYWSKTSPTGMAQTDSITEYAHIKLTSYSQGGIVSRNNGTTDGWKFYVNAQGQLILAGARAADDLVTSYQSVPLNKWVHVSASINTTTTTGVITIDGITVPSTYTNNANTGFAAPTQSYLVGATNGAAPTDFFPGKIAQAASFGAVISAATIQSYLSQSLAGTETSLISAYSFNGNANDLNANANNLTANNAAAATNADSPFGGQADGTISSTLDYGIVTKAVFSTNTTLTIQVPEGCAIPTTGGVASVAYSSVKVPYGMPVQRGKWAIDAISKITLTAAGTTTSTWYASNLQTTVPVGEWNMRIAGTVRATSSVTQSFMAGYMTLATTSGAETDAEMSGFGQATSSGQTDNFAYFTKDKFYSVPSAQTYYVNIKSNNTSLTTVTLDGAQTPAVLRAECAYL